MHTHPTMTLSVEQRAFEERMGIPRRGKSNWHRSKGNTLDITIATWVANLQQMIADYTQPLRVPSSAKQSDIASSVPN